MYLILNKEKLVLATGEHGWVKIHEWQKIRVFSTFLGASQHAMKVGMTSMNVLGVEDVMMNLIKALSFLGDSLHDLLCGADNIQSLADVGGLIEHKAMISDLTDMNIEQQKDLERTKAELNRVTLKMEEMANIITNVIK